MVVAVQGGGEEMSKQIRADFWTCEFDEDMGGRYCGCVNPASDFECHECHYELDPLSKHEKAHPSSKEEVMAYGLIASVPKHEGVFWVYTVHDLDGATLLRKKARVYKVEGFDQLFSEIGSASSKHETKPGWLWEPAR
jgi:hypothetical protein